MFSETAELYDRFYSHKDYAAEAERVRDFVVRAGGPGEGTLLDVACGTGGHVAPFRAHYSVEGVDLDERLLAVARRKHPDVRFHRGDMATFRLGRRFDVVTCLFSSIGYTRAPERMRAAVANMARHVEPGGALVVEPWFTPESFVSGRIYLQAHDEEHRKAVRISRSWAEGAVSIVEFSYLIGTPERVRHAVERHEVGLFTREQMTGAMESAGLRVEHDPEGLIGRGLYVGISGG